MSSNMNARAIDFEDKNDIIWQPQKRQALFLACGADETLYGGAAGGGKSDALLIEATRQANIPHYAGVLFRKTYPELEDLIKRSYDLYKYLDPRANFNISKSRWDFSSGGRVYFSAIQRDSDARKHQGRAYDFIGFDELTHFTWSTYSYLMSRNRPSGEGTRVYMKNATNPGGIGHSWVKQRYITGYLPEKIYWNGVPVVEQDGSISYYYMSRAFIPAKLFDNRILMKNDPNYIVRMSQLPKAQQDALLHGDWDSFSGQAFSEFRDDRESVDDRFTHVIKPFDIPDHWPRYRSLDWGYSKPFSVGYWAVDTNGILYRYKEIYGCADTKNAPDVGLKLTPKEVAKQMIDFEGEERRRGIRFRVSIADPAIFGTQTGISIADEFSKHGIYFDRGDNTRLAGKMQMHHRLAFDPLGKPMLYVFDNCKDFIRTIPAIVYSEKRPEDIDTDQEDHVYDESRYMLMEHLISARKNYFGPGTTLPEALINRKKKYSTDRAFMRL